MSLLVLGPHVLHQFSFQLILLLLTPNLSLQVLNQIEAAQQIILDVPLDHVRESSRPVFTLVQRVLDELIESLIIVLGIVHGAWAFAYRETSNLFRHVLRSTFSSFSFSLLHVLFF